MAASSVSVLGAGLMSGGARTSLGDGARFYKFVYDPDHAAASDFALSAREAGVAIAAVGADVTALWYDDLYHHWQRGPAALAGLTSQTAAYCIEVLARDAGLRTVFRGVHTPLGAGRFAHALSSVRPTPVLPAGLPQAPGWGAALSSALRLHPAAGDPDRRLPIDYAPVLHPARTQPLVSWLIEPPASA